MSKSIKAIEMIERVRQGEDAGDVIAGKDVKQEEGKEDGKEEGSLRERTERFLGARNQRRQDR